MVLYVERGKKPFCAFKYCFRIMKISTFIIAYYKSTGKMRRPIAVLTLELNHFVQKSSGEDMITTLTPPLEILQYAKQVFSFNRLVAVGRTIIITFMKVLIWRKLWTATSMTSTSHCNVDLLTDWQDANASRNGCESQIKFLWSILS